VAVKQLRRSPVDETGAADRGDSRQRSIPEPSVTAVLPSEGVTHARGGAWPAYGLPRTGRGVLTTRRSRRTFLGAVGGLAATAACTLVRQDDMTTLVTFGDSMLDESM
jgi:hypothetical protein